MKHIIIIILFSLLLISSASARIGLGDWSRKTPNDSEINNFYDDGLTLRLKNRQYIHELTKWYFYKRNVIGQLHNGSYFAANEETCQVNYFQNSSDFNHFIKTHRYKPMLWTRWYTTDWAPLDDISFLLLIFLPYSIFLAILFCVICYGSVITEKLNYRKPFTKILIGLLSIVTLNILLERLPQSI